MATKVQRLSLVKSWRENFAKAMESFRDDGAPEIWSDVFVPLSHYKALLPQTQLVEGMRGAGKSFWTRVLNAPQLRTALADSQIDGRLNDELKQIADCKGICWDQALENGLPNKISVRRWLDQDGFEPMLFWAIIVLAQFKLDPASGIPAADPHDPWSARINWAQQHPERVTSALRAIDSRFVTQRQTVLVVIDGLDVVSSRFADTHILMRGLFQILLDFRFAKGLRFKVFVREDILTSAAASVSDASKIINEKITLVWTQQDLFGLAFHYLGQRSSAFRSRLQEVSSKSWKSVGTRWEHPDIFDAQTQEKLWVLLAGSYMGNTVTKGHSYSWIFKHLADGKGRVSPRTFLKAIKRSLETSRSKFPEHRTVLHHDAIRDGVRYASGDRVNELDNEYQWVKDVLSPIRINRKTVPLDWDTLLTLWHQNQSTGEDTLSRIEASQEHGLIPWESKDPWKHKVHALRDTMVDIGVLQLRERHGVPRIDLPDIYRLGYHVGRYGGISISK